MFRAPVQVAADSSKKPKGTLGQYFATIHCPVCEQLTTEGVCATCSRNPQKVALSLNMRIHDTEKVFSDIEEVGACNHRRTGAHANTYRGCTQGGIHTGGAHTGGTLTHSLTHTQLCRDCVGSRDHTHHSKCISLDCPVLYRKHRSEQELATSESLRKLLEDFISTAVTYK